MSCCVDSSSLPSFGSPPPRLQATVTTSVDCIGRAVAIFISLSGDNTRTPRTHTAPHQPTPPRNRPHPDNGDATLANGAATQPQNGQETNTERTTTPTARRRRLPQSRQNAPTSKAHSQFEPRMRNSMPRRHIRRIRTPSVAIRHPAGRIRDPVSLLPSACPSASEGKDNVAGHASGA